MAKLSTTNFPNSIEFKTSLNNLESSGDFVELNVSENNIGIGACLGYSYGNIVLSNTDSASIILCSFLALETGTGNKKLLTRGLIRNDIWSFTSGDNIYISNSTPGLLTNIVPSNSGDIVQLIGIALNSNLILFDPDKTWLII